MQKYADLVVKIPGVVGIGMNDDEFTVYVKYEETAGIFRKMLSEKIDGISVRVVVRTHFF